MNLSDTSPEPITVDDSNTPEVGTAGAEPNTSMQEYYKLQQEL
ncbi:MAG: ATP synthase subunit I, partial [Okeania sp. SIO2D1]|nr:ATP synthase subunit I [Okeania sp. SIO2D1]